MSRENVEIVRRIYEAAARRDSGTILALYDRDVEWDNTRMGAVPGMYHGHDGLRRWFKEFNEAWEGDVEWSPELLDAGESVVSSHRARARGRLSGVEVEGTHYAVWRVRDGKVVRVTWFPTREEALEAAGVSE